MIDDDPPRPPPLPLDATTWEAEAHRVDMAYWEYCRAARANGNEPLDLETFISRSRSQVAEGLGRWRVDWDALWNAPSQPEWLLEPLIATGRAHALYAGAKTGKSYLMLPAAAALATGRPFLHQPAGKAVEVVYLDYEMTEDDLAERLAGFGYGPGDDLSHLHYILLPTIPGLDTEDGSDYVVDYCREVGARLCVIDTTARAMDGPENDADTYAKFSKITGVRLKSWQIACVRLDHAGKDVTKGQRGTSAKNDDVDVVWQLTRKDGGNELRATHRRMSWVPETVDLTLREVEGVHAWGTVEQLWPSGTKEMAALLERLGVPLDASVRGAAAILRAGGEGGRQTTILAGLKWRRMGADLASLVAVTPSGNTFRVTEGPKSGNGEMKPNVQAGKHLSVTSGNRGESTGVTVPPSIGGTGSPDQADAQEEGGWWE